jgi:membrane-bound serine protease (ClpP class)
VNKKSEMSALKSWLLVLVALADDIVILALIFFLLWVFRVKITWWMILSAVVFIIVFAIIMHKAVIPAFRRRKVTGAEGMIGAFGKAREILDPSGQIEVNGEYWKATSVSGKIEEGKQVEVVSINGLELEVKEKVNG